MKNIKKVSLFGIGSFGYAILKHLDKHADKNISLHAYDRDKKIVDNLKKERRHLIFHQSTKISNRVNIESSIKSLMLDCDVLILSITSSALSEVLSNIKKYINKKIIIVNTAKALGNKSGKRLSEIADDNLKGIDYTYSLLAGGTIARDLFKHEPLGINIACKDKEALVQLKNLFQSDNLFVYPIDDVVGAEYASSFKNVVSILAGITRGMGFSYGSETHIISRFAYEIEKLVTNELGGKERTFGMSSQCWGNDLWMSCTGNTRNREFGTLIGEGMSFEEALAEMKKRNKVVEGFSTIKILHKIKNFEKYYILYLLYKLSIKSVSLKEFKELIFNNKITE